MTTGLAPGIANQFLDALARATNVTAPTACWIKLHIGDPGAAGTANPAGETDRVQATFGSAAAGGAISNTVALAWTAVSNSEDYSHYSAWSASSGGTFLFSGTLTAAAVTAGDNFSIAIGDLDLAFTIAA